MFQHVCSSIKKGIKRKVSDNAPRLTCNVFTYTLHVLYTTLRILWGCFIPNNIMFMIELIHGDCLEEMKKIPDGSVDLVYSVI